MKTKLVLLVTAILALVLTAPAQIGIGIGVGVGGPPVCQYGYYNYAPYACSPYGFYGPDYFYNGIFIGVGPWEYWGHSHGWGEHRFHGEMRRGGHDRGFTERRHGEQQRRSEGHNGRR